MTEDNLQDVSDVQATPAAQAAAEEHGVDLTQVEGTGSEGTITKADVVAAAPPAATSGAEALAAEQGVDLRDVSAEGDKVTKADVQAHLETLGPTGPVVHRTEDPNFTAVVHVSQGPDGRWAVMIDPQFAGSGPSHEVVVSVGGRSVWQGQA